MDSQVSRRFLGSAGQKHALTQEAIEAALTLSGLRPGPTERRQFALQGIQSAGVLSLAFGIIFLAAFNWKYFMGVSLWSKYQSYWALQAVWK
jgi:hypothetical protein